MIAKSKIALIHVAKSKLGLSDEDYRSILNSIDVSSSKELDNKGFVKIIDVFKKLGFQSINKKSSNNDIWGCSPNQKKLIIYLWNECSKTKDYISLVNFIVKITGKSPAIIEKNDLEQIIYTIKKLKTT